MGRLIPAGTGQTYHEERRRNRLQPIMPIMPTTDSEEIALEADDKPVAEEVTTTE